MCGRPDCIGVSGCRECWRIKAAARRGSPVSAVLESAERAAAKVVTPGSTLEERAVEAPRESKVDRLRRLREAAQG